MQYRFVSHEYRRHISFALDNINIYVPVRKTTFLYIRNGLLIKLCFAPDAVFETIAQSLAGE